MNRPHGKKIGLNVACMTVVYVATIAVSGDVIFAQDPPPPPPPPSREAMEAALDDLHLSPEQRTAFDRAQEQFREKLRAARDEWMEQLRAILTPEQFKKLNAAMPTRPPPPPGSDGPPSDGNAPKPGDTRDDAKDDAKRDPKNNAKPDDAAGSPTAPRAQTERLDARPAAPLAAGETRVAVTFTGGHDTDGRDRGRPVTLIAAALGVPEDVFRETFTHVHPASAGGGPTDAQARDNKAALMRGLSKYGVTHDRLDEVSNYYRYVRARDELWTHRAAAAYATLKDGKITTVTLTDPGAGYTTPPAVKIEGHPDLTVTATLQFGNDLKTNGSLRAVTIETDAK